MNKPKSNQPDKLDQAKHKAVDYQTQSQDETTSNQPRSMKRWRSLIEERIQSAMDEGKFDNLPGRGEPLQRQENPFGDSSQELANGILKNNGYSPEWIDRDLSIRKDLQAAREALRTAWQYYQPEPDTELGWREAVRRFEEAMHKINRKIDDYNLVVPILSKQRLRLRLDEELHRIREN